MAGFFLAFGSCYQPHAPVRFDAMTAIAKAMYFMGDITYMDGSMGDSTGPINGELTESQVYNDTATGAIITVGAATAFNGVAGQLPIGAATVTNGGTGYPASVDFTAFLVGQGGSNAVVRCTTNVSGVITAANVITPGCGYGNAGNAAFTLTAMSWTSAYWPRRWNQIMRTPGWMDLQTARQSGFKFWFMPDDHEMSNNWDFSTAQAPTGANTAAKVLNWWRTSQAGLAQVMPTYCDNLPTAGRGDIPAPMVGVNGAAGVAAAADFPWYNLEHDYDGNGNLLADGSAPTVRVLVIDCVSGKHSMTATDDAAKRMIGDVQRTWLQTRCLDAKTKGVKAIWVLSGKDLFNLDNSDGWGATPAGGAQPYITQRDAILTWGQSNDIPWIWVCGDRHCAHAALRSTALGDSFDVLSVCPTPFGSKNGSAATTQNGNTPYPEMIWQHIGRDQTVHGMLEWDDARQESVIKIVDNADNKEQFAAIVPARSRIPSGYRMNRPA